MFGFVLLAAATLFAPPPEDELLAGDALVRACEPLAADVRACVVRFTDEDGDQIALGTIVHEQGWVVTKASLLPDEFHCFLSDGRKVEARWVGTAEESDLALLRVEGTVWAAPLAVPENYEPGQLLVAVGQSKKPLGIGVVSVPPRRIPDGSAFLGITMEEGDGGVRITQVVSGSAAEKAGVKLDDVVTEIDGEEVRNTADLAALIRGRAVGDQVGLAVMRDGERQELAATLGQREAEEAQPSARQGRRRGPKVDGSLSQRRNGFALALQHDIAISPSECGGPIVDLAGRVVAINIARAGRTQSLAIPISEVLARLGL